MFLSCVCCVCCVQHWNYVCIITLIAFILFITSNCCKQKSLKRELFGGSDWNTHFWGVSSYSGWPY